MQGPFTFLRLPLSSEAGSANLIFGNPVKKRPIDRASGESCLELVFDNGSIFALEYRILRESERIRHEHSLFVVEAGAPGDRMRRLPGLHPGAKPLLEARGARTVKKVLDWLGRFGEDCDPSTIAPEIYALADLVFKVKSRPPLKIIPIRQTSGVSRK